MAHTVFDRQILSCFPTVLREPIERRRYPWRNRLSTQLGIIAELAQQNVADSEAGHRAVEKPERAVLVNGGRRRRGSELNMVVLAGMLQEDSELHGVVADHL